jgi:hypothetical protein
MSRAARIASAPLIDEWRFRALRAAGPTYPGHALIQRRRWLAITAPRRPLASST